MGNRGATPSWDDEQIATFGLTMHMHFTASRHRVRHERQRLRQELHTLMSKLLDIKSGKTDP